MVCDRCIRSVEKIFSSLSVTITKVLLGEVHTQNKVPEILTAQIEKALKDEGFELIDTSTPVLVSKIKSSLIELFSQNEISEDFKLSAFLTARFPYDYSHLSRVFSHHEKDTIEHYLIRLRIEKAKELLAYKDQNVSEIAYRLGYASAAHFSRQFKKIVGVSPSVYKADPSNRISLEDL